jgi:hypothetical protein
VDPADGQRPLQVGAVHQLHDERRTLDAVDSRDVRVVQRRQHLGFALESRHPRGVADELIRQHLEGHRALEAAVRRTIDVAHAALPNQGGHFVGTNVVAEGDGHRK